MNIYKWVKLKNILLVLQIDSNIIFTYSYIYYICITIYSQVSSSLIII